MLVLQVAALKTPDVDTVEWLAGFARLTLRRGNLAARFGRGPHATRWFFWTRARHARARRRRAELQEAAMVSEATPRH